MNHENGSIYVKNKVCILCRGEKVFFLNAMLNVHFN